MISRTQFDDVERQENQSSDNNRTIQSVDRALNLLEALAAAGGELTLKELSARVGLSKSTCHGILMTLERRGYVGQTPSASYTLGLRLTELGTVAVDRLDLRVQAHDVLEDLSSMFQETVHLVTLEDAHVVYIDKVESEQSMRTVTRVGRRLPAWYTGVGKAILANLDPAHTERLLARAELKPFTRNSITDKSRMREYLTEVRRLGYAIDDEEFADGLRCVAAPIFDHTGHCVGALSISGPSVRMGPARISEMIPATMQAARLVSRRMGYRQSARFDTRPIPDTEEGSDATR